MKNKKDVNEIVMQNVMIEIGLCISEKEVGKYFYEKTKMEQKIKS